LLAERALHPLEPVGRVSNGLRLADDDAGGAVGDLGRALALAERVEGEREVVSPDRSIIQSRSAATPGHEVHPRASAIAISISIIDTYLSIY
jgi:hypothetical protein